LIDQLAAEPEAGRYFIAQQIRGWFSEWDDDHSMSATYSNIARRLFRNYRNGPITLGHSVLRRALELGLSEQEVVRLRSGLRLQLDRTKGNQNTIFWQDGDIEVQLYWAIRELMPIGGMFVDCGANCGLMGLLARQYRQARVLFVEPHPRLAATVEANIRLNGFGESCELAQCAASDRDGEVEFYEDPREDGSHSIHKDWSNGMLLGKVKCARLANLLTEKRVAKVQFLKVDTEGNDLAVLRGAGDWLKPESIELIYVEVSREQEAICNLLESRGYVGFVKAWRNRRDTARKQREYERGGSVGFFTPLRERGGSPSACDRADNPGISSSSRDACKPIHGEVLWCGKDSPALRHLTELATK
jgi:FkbM family methyltransferase